MTAASEFSLLRLSEPRSKLLLVVGAWTIIALFFASRQVLLVATNENPPSWWKTLLLSLLEWYLWAAFTPLIVWIANRLPVSRTNALYRVPIQIAAWFVIAAIHLVLYTPVLWLTLPEFKQSRNTYPEFLSLVVNASLHEGVLICLGIVLVSRLVEYYRRYQESQSQAAHLKSQLMNAELQALKMQLHPHFLFNTLHAISTLIYKDPEAADRMLARLSELLRLTLENAGTQEVTLRREMEFLERYLAIQQLRFQDRLTIRLDVAPDTLDALVPNLILQPLAENAVRHGIAGREEGGAIEIHAARDNGRVIIRVRDNGQGRASAKPMAVQEGFGLGNTRARLKQLYGSAGQMELGSDADGAGFTVELSLPFRQTTRTADEA